MAYKSRIWALFANLGFLQDCDENSWKLKLAHAHSGQPRRESLMGSLDFDARCTLARVSRYWSQERASWCTGQPPLRWSVAGYDAFELVQFGIGGGCLTRSRRAILFAILQPVKMSMLAVTIVRPTASIELGLNSPWEPIAFACRSGWCQQIQHRP